MSFFPYIPSLTLPPPTFSSPAVSILLPIALGSAVGYSTSPRAATSKRKVYASIRQPPFHPPPRVFGPAWTILYGTMGYAAHHATTSGLRSPSPRIRHLALVGATLYTTQLTLNLAWIPLFFGLRRPGAALMDIVALIGNVGCLAWLWGGWDPLAAWLLAPYLGWLGFATYLNAGVGVLNGWNITAEEEKKKY